LKSERRLFDVGSDASEVLYGRPGDYKNVGNGDNDIENNGSMEE